MHVCAHIWQFPPLIQFHWWAKFGKQHLNKVQRRAVATNFFICAFCFIMLETLIELCSKLLTYDRRLWRQDFTDIQNKEKERVWKLQWQGCLSSFEVVKWNPWLIGLANIGRVRMCRTEDNLGLKPRGCSEDP